MYENESNLTPLVHKLIDYLFQESERAEARFLISECPDGSGDRIHIACIKQADGCLSSLASAVDQANYDWRDLLMGTGFGHNTYSHMIWAEQQLKLHRPSKWTRVKGWFRFSSS